MSSESKISINLESLLALGDQLNETNDENSILNIALLSLMGKLKIFRGIVFVPDKTGEYFIPTLHKGKKQINKIRAIKIDTICQLKDGDGKNNEIVLAGYEICIPVIYRKELFAVICLSKTLDSKKLSDEEYYYASLVSTITSNALNNTKNRKLLINEKTIVESRNQLLTTLFEVSRDFNIFLSDDKIIKTLSYNLLGQLMITKYAVIYIEDFDVDTERENRKNVGKAKHIVIQNTFKEHPPQHNLEELFVIKKTCYAEDIPMSRELEKWFKRNEVRVISPMTVQGDTKGFLLIGKKTGGIQFTEENLLFIQVIGNTSVLALENLKLIRMEVERQKLENELSLALEIQKNLLPKDVPGFEGFDLYGLSNPSRQVGGDYYDFIELPNGNLLIAIADVSGKGMPAALLMANVQAALRVLAPLSLPLDKLLNRLNYLVYNNTSADRFVTFFCGELNLKTMAFKYINAGHNPPIFNKSNGEIKFLTHGGIILGVLEDVIHYHTGEEKLQKGDVITFYTDGVSEAINEDNEEFGEKRLITCLKNNLQEKANKIIHNIIKDVKSHTQSQSQFDDITIVVLKAES
ncbi:GAF domain-containing SpoIIE family protein phosphatase [Bacteroidota bacterium]